jgi:chemotaxis protein MotB
MNSKLVLFSAVVVLMTGCVSQKKFKAKVSEYDSLKKDYEKVDLMLSDCASEREKQASKIKTLEDDLAYAKKNSSVMINQLQDMSVISAAQSESIKKSLENINSKDSYIKNLQTELSRKDSLNMALVLNLKGALKDVNDDDVQIKVEGSAVFISISDKMLFRSGSYEITPRAKDVLGKVATVIKAQPDVQFMVEGHTDNKAISTSTIRDNWDLSVLRSASVVRTLQKQYGVDPARMIAAGRSEFVPLTTNATVDGRALNRRTRIVILPQLDQFFKLMEPSKN